MIVLLAVILFPPRELPKLARSVARVYGTIRRTAEDFKAAILEDPDLNEPIDEIKSAYRSTRWEVQRAEEAARRELAKARMEARMAVRAKGGEARPGVPGRVAVGEDDFDEPEDLDAEFGQDPEELDEPAPHLPLAVAVDPDDDDGGDGSAKSQGAA